MRSRTAALVGLLACTSAAFGADNARFDLAGPSIDIRVTRGATTLPIAEVPNLLPGDKLWVKADLPPNQSNHLLLVVAFLRGTTNEPPDNWFTEIDTWEKKTVEGTTITVPDQAQQALLFIAPETGGDFKTLRSAVKGKPGLFIRADSDLNQASFEQGRIERYLAAMKNVPQDDQKAIADRSAKLAATLALKPNADCFKQPVEQQVNCLTQSSAPVLLDDGHGQGIAEALSTGASSDFINAASYTQPVGGGTYSAYVGAVVDLVHLASTLRTADYQYIPGLSFPQGATLNLKLNTPPSFHKPESVIVVGLPAIQKAILPPLRAQHPDQVACLLQPNLTLPLEGAPLVFSTGFAHDLTLHLNRTGSQQSLPLTPDAFEGGLVKAKEDGRQPLPEAHDVQSTELPQKTGKPPASSTDLTLTGTVQGYWGFDPFTGPVLTLQQVAGKGWKITGNTDLLAGKDNHLTLEGDGTACIQKLSLTSQSAKAMDVSFKPAPGKDAKPALTPLDVDVPLEKVQLGGYALAIEQYGDPQPSTVDLKAYSGDIHLDTLKIHTGDNSAELTGQHLEEVVSAQIGDQSFIPASGSDSGDLHLEAKAAVSPKDGTDATVKLKDGRTLTIKVTAEAARPGLKLLSMNDTPGEPSGALPVHLQGKNDIALSGKLTFVVQTEQPFPRNQQIEVATADGAVHTKLSLADNTLVLQDEHTAVATLDPQKAFGDSAFGPLQMRPVAADGTPGHWTSLGQLVRTPQITAIQCTNAATPTCTLSGDRLFLVQAFGAAQDFTKPTEVPTGFAQNSMAVPVPADGSTLFVRLRDDPQGVATVELPTPLPKAASPTSDSGASPAAAKPAQPASPPAPSSAATSGTPSQPSPAATAANPAAPLPK